MKKSYSMLTILGWCHVMVALSLLHGGKRAEGAVGITWAQQTSTTIMSWTVRDILLENGIKEVKVFDLAENVTRAFANHDINITFGINNEDISKVKSSPSYAKAIVERIINGRKRNISISAIHVGDGPFTSKNKKKMYLKDAVDVMKSLQTMINEQSHGKTIKVTIPHSSDVLILTNTSKPSEAEFHPEIKDLMVDSIKFLQKNNAPMALNFYPFLYASEMQWSLDFTFMDNKSNFVIMEKTGLTYHNAFDFIYDAFYSAAFKIGVSHDMKLIVSQIGWATDGHPHANVANAQRFYKGFLPHATSKKGTPLFPGAPIDVFIHSLFDANRAIIDSSSPYERHWGIYRYNGQPKYQVDFSGEARDVWPTAARYIFSMPRHWCMFSGDISDQKKVEKLKNLACSKADCTSLAAKGSCGDLDYNARISYAFNNYFQEMGQFSKKNTCDFEGLGRLTTNDPSNGTCVFPISIRTPNIEYLLSSSAERSLPDGVFAMTLSLLIALLFFVGYL